MFEEKDKYEVGIVEGYPVFYIPKKDVLFCKNTSVKYSLLKQLYDSPFTKERIEEKSLDVVKDEFFIRFGCLNTNRTNCKLIINNIKKLRHV